MNKSRIITPEILEELPNIVTKVEYSDGIFNKLTYIGFCIVEFFDDNELKYFCGEYKDFLSYQDIKIIKAWYPNKDDIYFENGGKDYYRFDFDEHIFLFENNEFDNGRVLMGNLLQKDLETRLQLISFKQNYLMRLLFHGQQYISAG